jgi:predicted nicotinamide N-methyase
MKPPPDLAAAERALAAVPLVATRVEIADRVWSILAVSDQQALLDAADGFAHVPYGLLLWESAVALAQWVARRPGMVAGRRVMELGAGVGLPGLVAAACGGLVTQSDHEPAALALCRMNAERNAVAVPRALLADWRAWPDAGRYDVVLGADVLYEREVHGVILDLAGRLVAPGGLLVLTDPGRPHTLDLLSEMEDRGWRGEVTTVPVAALTAVPGGPATIEVTIAELRPPRPFS